MVNFLHEVLAQRKGYLSLHHPAGAMKHHSISRNPINPAIYIQPVLSTSFPEVVLH